MKKIEIINKTQTRIIKSLVEKIAKKILKKRNERASLVLVSSDEIKKLNWQYRKKNKPTEVLAFPSNFSQKERTLLSKEERSYLGEVVISLSEVKKRARLFGFSFKKEFARVFIHGLLHLLGYDHKTKKEAEKMEGRERRILRELKFL